VCTSFNLGIYVHTNLKKVVVRSIFVHFRAIQQDSQSIFKCQRKGQEQDQRKHPD
jgi:hypothetical protein